MRKVLSLGLLLAALACAGGGDGGPTGAGTAPGAEPGPEKAAIPDTEIGLMKGSVFDVPVPEPVHRRTSMPGEEPVLPRPYSLSPPVIPHAIVDFLPIDRESNYCIVCHRVEEKVEGEPTPIPPSHFVDLRRAPTVQGDMVAGARYNCLACHAVTTDAAPLVANEFRPD